VTMVTKTERTSAICMNLSFDRALIRAASFFKKKKSKEYITTGRIFVYSHGCSTLRPRCTHVQLIGRSHISRRLVIEWWRNFITSAGSFRSSPLSLGLISLLFYRIHRPAIRLHPLASPTSTPFSGSCGHLQQFGSSVKLFPPPLHARAKSPCSSF